MLKIFKHLQKFDWLYVFFSLIFIVTGVWLDLKLPDYMSEITRLVQTEGSAMDSIFSAGTMMLLCAFGSLVTTFAAGYLVAKIAAGLAMRLREKVYNKTIAFSMEEVGKFGVASLITRSTNDITQIQSFTAIGLQAIVKAPIMAAWAILKISGKGLEWSFATGAAVCVLLLMLGTIIALTMPKFTIIQKLTDNLNRVTRENLTGIRVIRAYNAGEYQENRFENVNKPLTNTNLFTNRIMAIMNPGMTLIMSGLTLAIYWIGAYIIGAADSLMKLNMFSDMVVFTTYAMQVIMAFMMLTMTLIILPRANASAKRVNDVLDTKIKIKNGNITKSELFEKGEIEFQNVSFKYPDAAGYVLRDITFTAHTGETVAFIGATGSGKSTLVNLIPRFYDVTEGQILIDGINVKDYTAEALRNKLGYVPQKAVIFGGSVSSNIAYGENGKKPPDAERIQSAANLAQANEFIGKMEEGYHTQISQGGTNISGGQKQRLSIARAVCRNPEIYIFDDSFSALDYKTERIVRKTLRNETNGATTLIVAQRIGTIMDADKIIVLDEGKIVGSGKHKELLKNCPVYKEIAESQLSKEELDNG